MHYNLRKFLYRLPPLPPSRAMTPGEQMDIIKICEATEAIDERKVTARDLQVEFLKMV